MTIRHLKIFCEVYKELNMTSVAKKLYMTQPSVSQAIKELEEFYGIRLFERLSQKLYVTSAGEKLYKYSVHIIHMLEEAQEVLQDEKKQLVLNVGVNYTVGLSMIHNFILRYQEVYPEAMVHVKVNKASILKDMLRSNQLDFCLVELSADETDFCYEPFWEDRICIVAHPDSVYAKTEISPKELAEAPLLVRERGAGARDMFEANMMQLGYRIEPLWESISATALINATLLKKGVAVLPYEAVKEKLDTGILAQVPADFMNLNRELAVTYHKNKYLTDQMWDFIKICKEVSCLA